MTQPPLGITARAVIDRIIDGDTLDVLLTIPVRVRLKNCWAPEIHGVEKPLGIIAKEQLERMAPVGSHVRVNVPTGEVDAMAGVFTFGRVVGDVWREGDSDSLGTLMVASGVASYEKRRVGT